MAHYLVTATATGDLSELRERLESGEIRAMRPFGKALHHSLTHARQRPDGRLVWEEEDYCSPPLAMERAAVLEPLLQRRRNRARARGGGLGAVGNLAPLWPKRLG